MKKILLALVFVLVTGTTFMNANNEEIKFAHYNLSIQNANNLNIFESLLLEDKIFFDCWESADLTERFSDALADAEGRTLTYEQRHNVWVAAYETCMN